MKRISHKRSRRQRSSPSKLMLLHHRRDPYSWVIMLGFVLHVLLLHSTQGRQLLSDDTSGGLPCSTDLECIVRYNGTLSECVRETGTCSNPFAQGCLIARLGDNWGKKRVCNSDDDDDDNNNDGDKDCRISMFDMYPEIRIHNGNWESSIFMAWIYQILLMELVDVPSTVGLTTRDTPLSSFYNAGRKHNLGMVASEVQYPWDAIQRGHQVSDCSETNLPCVQFLPEVWNIRSDDYSKLLDQDVLEPRSPNGLLGRAGLMIPISLAERHPDLSIWFGWKGEDKRQFLAETFHRPVTWLEYCDTISTSNCQEPDDTATQAPGSAEEGARYFVRGSYQGYFRPTDKNNCTANPTTCTGAIMGPPCDWSGSVEGQLYHNGIVGLELEGPLEPNGFTSVQLQEIWKAANVTKSPVIMHWYEPDPLPVNFFGTDYELQRVAFPAPSYECERKRPTDAQKCSSDFMERVGDPEGACSDRIEALSNVIAKSVGTNTYEQDEADQSPAYALLKNIKVSNIDMAVILQAWQQGNDPRAAVCDWVVENLENLQAFVPPGYPRQTSEKSAYSAWYMLMSQIIGGLVGLSALVALILCYKYRETKTMVFTQPLFMMLILCGFLMICAGSVLLALEPTFPTCTSSTWLIVQGYTIELSAVLVKTSAINTLIQSSKKMKRVNIRRNVMLMKVLGVVLFVTGCMIAWTLVDPPTAKAQREVTESKDDTVVVEIDVKCSSEWSAWRFTAYGWQLMLLIVAGVLAYQSRHAMEQLNESKSLAMMVYSHFLFVMLRGVCSVFYVYNTLPSSVTSALFSLNYSLDSLFAMAIYVFPKIWEAWKSPGDYRPGRFTAEGYTTSNKNSLDDIHMSRELELVESYRDDADDIKILVCTANLGNAEPTMDSLEAWVPPGGSCYRVQTLEGVPDLGGTFDVVAIGFQEATWTDSSDRSRRQRAKALEGEALTEEEVLAALEEKNTSTLRGMLQETLGDSYCQVADEQRGQMRLHLWARRSILKGIKDIRISGANTGVGNMLANKGGIVATLYYKSTRISFLTAHLAAHEGRSYYKARCDNMKAILREAKTFGLSKKFDETMTSHHMFVFGDLNFRTAFGAESKHEDNIHRANELIIAKDFESLYAFDELEEGLAAGHLLSDFTTLRCNFPPTFKVERRPGFVYKEQRTPSYTDRILFKSAQGLSPNLRPLAYEPCPDFITSDHKPLRAAYSLTPNDAMGLFELHGDLHIEFRRMKCSNLPAADSDGKSDPYLMFIWDSIDLHTDNRALMDKIRELWMGRSWPRTRYISKTLNPYWKGERMRLSASDTNIGRDAMLFVAAIDFDAVGKDDFLGGICLNVRELIHMGRGEVFKTVDVDQNLTRNGKYAGRIKCKIDISIMKRTTESSRLVALGNAFRSTKSIGRIGGSSRSIGRMGGSSNSIGKLDH